MLSIKRMMCLIISLIFCTTNVICRDDFWYPVYDGCKKIEALTASNFDSVIKAPGVCVVAFLQQADDNHVTENVLDTIAPQLLSDDIKVYTLEISTNPELITQEGIMESGEIHIYVDGNKRLFRGYLSAETLLSFIAQAVEPAVKVISDKQSKKIYDKIYSPKVLAYLDFISPARQVYRDIANLYYPSIHFFEINDPVIAADLMKKAALGTIQLKHPNEKNCQVLVRNEMVSLAEDLTQFLDNVGQPLLQTISPLNMQEIWNARQGEHFVIAFTKHKSPLFKLLQSRVKYLTGDLEPSPTTDPNTADPTATPEVPEYVDKCVRDLPIATIDVNSFPQLIGHWQRKLNVNLQESQMALLDRTNLKAVWFDMNALTTLATDNEKKTAIGKWICDITNGIIQLEESSQLRPESNS